MMQNDENVNDNSEQKKLQNNVEKSQIIPKDRIKRDKINEKLRKRKSLVVKKKGVSPIPNAKQFSSEYQPSKEARSRGQNKYWEYRKARQKFYEELCEIKLPNGKTVDFWKEIKNQIHFMVLDKKSKLKPKEKVNLMLELVDKFMPEQKNVKIDSDMPLIINIGSEDADL